MHPPPAPIDVVVVTYHFPPTVSGGTRRPAQMYAELIEHGWRPLVVTSSPAALPRALRLPNAYLDAGPPPEPHGQPSWTGRLRRWLRLALLWPDSKIIWSVQAIGALDRLRPLAPPRVVITTSPPESLHFVGYWLQRRRRCTWIADFRDGWLVEALRSDLRLAWRRRIEARLERAVMDHADGILFSTRALLASYQARYPRAAARMLFVPTRWTPTSPPQVRRDPERLDLVHTGRFSLSEPGRSPFPLLAALAALPGDLRRRLRLTLAGKLSADELCCVADQAGDVEVVCPGELAADATRDLQRRAHGLVLVTAAHCRHHIPSKLYEYLEAGRPVLAFTDNPEIRRLLETCGAGSIQLSPSRSGPDAGATLRRWIERLGEPGGAEPLRPARPASSLQDALRGALARRDRRISLPRPPTRP